MLLQRITHFLLKHFALTTLLVFCIAFIPLTGAFAIVIAALVVLCDSVTKGTLLALVATVPYLINFYFSKHAGIPLVMWAPVGVAVTSNLLTWLFAVMLRKQVKWSVLLQTSALLGVLFVSVVHLVYPNITSWWGAELRAYYLQVAAITTAQVGKLNSFSPEAQLASINLTKQYATGLFVAAILCNAFFQLVIARWWQSAVFNKGSLRKELTSIRLSYLAGVLFVLSLVFSYLGNPVVLDVMPIIYILFCVAGLSLIHYLFRFTTSTPTTSWLGLFLLYLILILGFPMSIMFVSILALFDAGLDLRKRFRHV